MSSRSTNGGAARVSPSRSGHTIAKCTKQEFFPAKGIRLLDIPFRPKSERSKNVGKICSIGEQRGDSYKDRTHNYGNQELLALPKVLACNDYLMASYVHPNHRWKVEIPGEDPGGSFSLLLCLPQPLRSGERPFGKQGLFQTHSLQLRSLLPSESPPKMTPAKQTSQSSDVVRLPDR